MSITRKCISFFVVSLLIWVGILAYNRLTDGFSIHQITSSLPPCPHHDIEITQDKKEQLRALLDQKFHYLGKGCQFYVFESEDGKYVIKFLKHKHLRPFTWLKAIPMTPKLRQLCDAKMERRAERVNRLFTSCKLAYEKMPEETGLLFIHLNRTPQLEKQVTIIDKIGCKHTIMIDDYEYFVQKRAHPVKEIFATCDEREIPSRVQTLIHLVLARCSKGIGDRDRAFVQNVAFLEEDDQAIFIDFGQFYENSAMKDPTTQAEDLNKRLHNLKLWAEKHFPDRPLCI